MENASWSIEGILEKLLGAPVANLGIVAGLALLLCAVLGKLPRIGRIDPPGRTLAAMCGIAFAGAGFYFHWYAVRLNPAPTVATAAPLEVQPPAATLPPATLPPAGSVMFNRSILRRSIPAPPAPTPAPTPAPSPIPETLRVAEKEVNWGCEETVVTELTYQLPADLQLRSAEIETANTDKLKAMQLPTPVYDSTTRTIMARPTFTGLDRILFNCPGGGHATARLKLDVLRPAH